jgi:hypothetical protein
LTVAKQLQTSFDVDVGWIEFGRTLIGVERIVDLVMTGLVQGAEIVPHLGDVGIQTDGARVGVQRIAILIDLVVEHPDGAPEGGVATVTVDRLLVGLVGFVVLLLRHVAATEEIP